LRKNAEATSPLPSAGLVATIRKRLTVLLQDVVDFS
jgi:hypothetical protein